MKRVISVLLSALLLVSLLSVSAFASEALLSDAEEKLVDAAMEVHLHTSVEAYRSVQDDALYEVFDKNGNDITARFIADTKEFVNDNNRAAIADYCDKNVGYFVTTTESVVPVASDLSKTVTKNYVQSFNHSNNTSCTIDYDIVGSITYDPNTYQISYASTPRMSRWVKSAPDQYTIRVQNTNYRSSIASNKLSASFSFSFDVRATSSYGEDFIYGSPSGSFTIVPD